MPQHCSTLGIPQAHVVGHSMGSDCPRVGFITHGKRQKLDSAIVLAKGDSKFQALIELFVSCL